mmetsp:Transcript_52363/g.103980  ORF Transcript_52363/g.103980 Transcript_52363/m.103980 type:complete len:490 (+) Transcript_52363:48-1517(+)
MLVSFLALALIPLVAGRISSLHGRRETIAGGDTYCTEPVAKGKVVFPDSLAGRTVQNYDMYSGYVNITTQDWLFYWFFEADASAVEAYSDPADVPLIIWTNGGPGCSAMEGATTENGPLVLYRIKESYDLATGQLSDNPYAWNKQGHVLYVDQPKGVGNSFGYGAGCKSSVEAGLDIVTFIQGWYDLFPEYASNKVVVSGESYGGHYIPAWANAILDHNQALATNAADTGANANKEHGRTSAGVANAPRPIPMVGVAIGNGCVNNTVQDSAKYIEFLQANKLLPAGAEPKSQAVAEAQMINYIGYQPNFYDFRVQDVKCNTGCYSYNYTEWSYWFLKSEVIEALHICGDAGYDAFAGSAGGCINLPGFDSGDAFDYSAALGRALDSGVSVLFFYGKNDLACNYVGGYAMTASLPWAGAEGFKAAPLEPFGGGGLGVTSGGEAQVYRPEEGDNGTAGKLMWVQVNAAGHMVPLDEPPAAATALSMLLAEI